VKKLVYLLILLILPCLIISGIVSASDTSQSAYYGILTVTNNSTATTVVSTNISGLNSTEMIAQGWLNSSANNCAIQYSGGDIPFMPGNGTSPWMMFVNSIPANSQLNYTFYTDDVTGGKIAYFPGSTGMAVTDAASIEPSANFSISMTDTFIDTTAGTGKYIFNKESALYARVSPTTSGKIESKIPASPTSTNDPSTAWTNDANAIDGNLATTATANAGAGAWTGYLEMPHANVPVTSIFFKASSLGVSAQINIDAYYGGGWNTIYSALFTYDTLTELSLPVTQNCTNIRARIKNGDVGATSLYLYEVYYGLYLSSVGESIGEHDIEITSDSTNLMLKIDGATKDSLTFTGNTILNNTNNWQFGSANTTPYITSCNITVGGNLRGSWKWNYGATFPDDSGNSNTATPSFRTTSSDADVSASLISFSPVTEPTAPAFVVGSGPAWFSTNVTISGNYTSGNTTLNYPGRAFIESLASATSTPAQLPVTIISGFLILAVSITASAFLRLHGSGTLFVKICVLAVGFGFAVGLRIYDWWMIIFLVIFALFVLFGSKERTS
jgi:hypothetical protein